MAPTSRYCSSPSSADAPLTAERAMMDQIRSKLERAQRRLARTSSGSSGSHVRAGYDSAIRAPPVKSVLLEDMPATTSRQYTPPSTLTHPAILPPSSRHSLPCTRREHKKQQAFQYASQQYKSRSKYSLSDTDPLNGGPPPLSTPYLVYAKPRPTVTRPKSSVEKRSQDAKRRDSRHIASNIAINDHMAAMRADLARPPTSRVRFEGHEDTCDNAHGKHERNREEERMRRQQQLNEREARYQRQREDKMKSRDACTTAVAVSAATLRGRPSLLEKPPSSAIKVSAYNEIAQTMPASSVERRSLMMTSPPKSDIKVSAFDEFVPRERFADAQRETMDQCTKQAFEENRKKGLNLKRETKVAKQVLSGTEKSSIDSKLVYGDTNRFEGDDGDTSTYDTDDSFEFDSDSEKLTYAEYSILEARVRKVKLDALAADESRNCLDARSHVDLTEEDIAASGIELSTVKEEDEDASTVKLTAKDLALYALGRTSSHSLSDLASPVVSASKSHLVVHTQAPVSYTPTPSAFPSSRALGSSPRRPATTGRTSSNQMAQSPSAYSYVRRSLTRAPMDLKNHLPPSIGVLSGLSSGSSTFVLDSTLFYDVTWNSGEFAFSVQHIYTENEFEFDDRTQEPQLFLRMLLNTERSTCESFNRVRAGDVLIRVDDTNVSELGLEGSGSVLTKFFANLMGRTPVKLTFQRMSPSDWEGGVEL
ncbi:hypothetical protein CCR75_009123 [Bremia lactucae]|uniref:PDZ domain-containing protein n=1 Tax=Bremia lactucae TaxID=4779 RepID=A0A976FMU5_BRELC|nr:hypothetical protein CCR75_009123 [Bremia lactucae]